ncbi:MAG: glycosyltransferase family 4 protein, partial [Planctomycetes bacterium]|nr:glycosyltransferase family 4 protein [Planctomycetota bacterium]
ATNLAKLGCQVTVLCNLGPGQARDEMLDGVRVLRARMSLGGKTFPLLGLWRALGLITQPFDVVMERYVTFGGAGMVFSALNDVPLALEVNSPHVEELIWRLRIGSRAARAFLRGWVWLMFQRARLVLSPLESIVPASGASKVRLVSWGADVEKFRPDLRDAERCRQLGSRYGLEGKIVVLFTGTFRAWHGVLRLPSIIERVAAQQPDVMFLLVGKGECLDEVKRTVAERGLEDRVVFTGEQAHDEIPFFVAASDIGIAPYDLDAYWPLKEFGFFWSPLKIFEFMAGGLPVVTVDVPPLNQVVADGLRGRVAPPGNDQAMAEAIVGLVRDGSRRTDMGAQARAHVASHYSWAGHASVLMGYLADVVA